jgi:hypothetical protein
VDCEKTTEQKHKRGSVARNKVLTFISSLLYL